MKDMERRFRLQIRLLATGLLAVSITLLLAHISVAAPSKNATDREFVEYFVTTVSLPSTSKNYKGTFEDLAKCMDFEEMAKRCFGNDDWPKFKSDEQKEVTKLFRRLIQTRFYPRWQRVFQKGRFDISSLSKQNEDSIVAGTLSLDGKQTPMTFRLVHTRDGFKFVSMAVKDKDLLERTSVRLKKSLAQKGTAGLIAHLKKRNQEAAKNPTAAAEAKPELDELFSSGK